MYVPPHKHPSSTQNPTTSMVSERIAELLDQLKTEYSQLDSEFSVTKQQRDDYERKLELQLSEFQSMKQTISDLEMNFQSIRQQYEDKIIHLQQQLKMFQQGTNQPPPAAPSNLNTSNSPVPPLQMQGSTAFKSIRNSPTPSLKEGGRRSPPTILNPQPTKKPRLMDDQQSPYPQQQTAYPPVGSMNNPQQSSTLPSMQNTPQQQGMPSAHFPSMQQQQQQSYPSMMGQPQQQPPLQQSLPQQQPNTPLSQQPSMALPPSQSLSQQQQGSMTPSSMPFPMDVDTGFKSEMLKKEGSDWVVVYNPQVKTNANINLLHNLDHQSVVCCVRFSHDGKYLATGSNKMAQIFNAETGQKVRVFAADDKLPDASPPPQINNPSTTTTTTTPDESGLLPTTMNSMSNLLGGNPTAGEKEDSYVRSVVFSPDGKWLAAGAEDKTVKVWDIKTGQLRHAMYGHELDIYSLDFSYDNRFIVSGSGDGKAKIWSMETGKCEHTLGNDEIGPKEGVTSVAISPDGRFVAAGSLDCVVRLWDTQTGKHVESFKGHDDSVYSVAFSPDGKTLASGSLDKTLKLWDLSRVGGYRCAATLSGHRDYVLSVAFSQDGKWLISGSKDRSVQFWDPRSNVLHLMLQGHKNSVISVALSPTHNRFATGSGDFRARVWEAVSL